VLVRLVRVKLKPGRKLTLEYDVGLPAPDGPRRVAVAWVAPGGTAPGPAPEVEAEARRRGVLEPFCSSWIGSPDGRMSLSVAPVDGAFPQLVRWHDVFHVSRVLRGVPSVAAASAWEPAELRVTTVRYRPGQRHVLRVAVAEGPALFAKVYRDDTGQRAVEAAARTARALAAFGAVPRAPAVYVTEDRVALWPEVDGTSLADVIAGCGAAAAELVRAAGSALRLVHETSPHGVPAGPPAQAQAAESLRTGQIVEALAPAVGVLLRRTVGRALDVLSGLPEEPPTMTHGDFKCDNLLVDVAAGIHLLDFDRVGRADPAADVGKFLADLRWRTDGDGPTATHLHEAFRHGYGATDPARIARAQVYDALLQLRMAARRVPIQDPDWAGRVTHAVRLAAATLDAKAAA
jgi:aminoglycoside phosphotransferase (APT) family kinase protein